MTDPAKRFLAALREHGCEPRKSGAGWKCRCPAHEDGTPSLSIDTGDDGRVLVNCFAGCSVDAVCVAIGLRPADLFVQVTAHRNRTSPVTRRVPTSTESRRAASKGISVDVDAPKEGRRFTTANDAVAALERKYGPKSGWWTYLNADGEPVFVAVRFPVPPDPNKPNAKPSKTFRPVSRVEGKWVIGDPPGLLPLYHLPDLLAAPASSRVFVTEGEKTADAARMIGLTATTSPHGSKSAHKADWTPVAARHVVILVDHDGAGEKYGANAARLCMAAGALSVRIVRLVEVWVDMPEGGDLVDLLQNRGGDADQVRAEVDTLVYSAEPETAMPHGIATTKFTPFPLDVLPEPVRGFATEAAKAIGCDSSYIVLPLLSSLASAIGNTRRIQLKRVWSEPCIVWTAIVGTSGTKKSPPIELALSAIRKRQHDAMKEFGEAQKRYSNDLATYERDAAKWKRGNSHEPPPEKPDAPVATRCWTDDITTEALAVLLQQNPRGLLMVKDELGGWFNFDRYASGKGGGDVAKWLEMFGGRSMVVDRKSGGMLYVPRAAVSIAGGIQPETLRRALGQEYRDNGLAARLLFAMPPRTPSRWTEAEVSPQTEKAVESVFDRLFGLTPDADVNGDERPKLLPMTEAGKAAWVKFYNEHSDAQMELVGDEAAAWSKLEGYAARLALVVHMTRWAAGDATICDPAQIDEASIGAGVAMARWFGDEARRVYAMLAESDDDRADRQLVELIERKGTREENGVSMSARELVQASRKFPNVADAELALSGLAEAGAGTWMTPKQQGRGGPKARRFVLSPAYSVNVYRNATGGTSNTNPVDADSAEEPKSNDNRWGVV